MSEVLTGTISGTVKISGDLIPRGIDGYSPTIDVEPIDGGTKLIITDISGTKTATINDGATGAPGISGKDGKDGTPATHSWNGTTLTITSASGTSSADLKGAAGKDGYTPVKGKDYFDGTNGKDGVSVTHSWSGTTLNITSASGTSSANLKGETGAAGSNGKDGTSVTVKSVSESTADGGSNVVTFSDGKTLTVKNGKAGTGTAGKDGKSAYQYAVDGGYKGTEAEFATKLAEEIPKALTVMVEFDGSSVEPGFDFPAGYNVPYYQILSAYESGAVVICDFYDSSTYDEIVTPIIAYNNEEKWFYACGTGSKYRYFIRFTPEGAYANCETLSSGGGSDDPEPSLALLVTDRIESSPDPTYGVYSCFVAFYFGIKSNPETVSITLDGVPYNNLSITTVDVPDMGSFTVCGNLAMINPILGTAFENTGEPFLGLVFVTAGDSAGSVTFMFPEVEATMHTIEVYMPIETINEADRDLLPKPVDIDLVGLGLPALSEENTTCECEISEYAFKKLWAAVQHRPISVRFKASGEAQMTNSNGQNVTSFRFESCKFTGSCYGLCVEIETVCREICVATQLFGYTYHFEFVESRGDYTALAKVIGNGTI